MTKPKSGDPAAASAQHQDRAAAATLELIRIMAALRTPGSGCPWDLEQTFASIAPYTIEEAYEVADAIARGDRTDLRDELGDLLLQVAYHARMAEEEGAFDFADVAQAICAKMIRRHPHVFGDAAARSAGAAKDFWETAKAREKAGKSRDGVLSDVPVGLPALTRAVKLQNKAARVGFDWPSLAPVFDKLKEELAELETAAATPGAADAVAEEFGDLLFVVANVARHLRIDPEAALRGANAKFVRRFAHIEQRLAEDGRSPEQSTLEEMDRLWDEAKRIEKGQSRA
ncbi:MAG: nucleoside triphosphate pyrophosphohydrolase [Hyphomicrobiaceae bacterium]